MSDRNCVVCGKSVPEIVALFLEDFGVPPICSMDCASIAAELHRVEWWSGVSDERG